MRIRYGSFASYPCQSSKPRYDKRGDTGASRRWITKWITRRSQTHASEIYESDDTHDVGDTTAADEIVVPSTIVAARVNATPPAITANLPLVKVRARVYHDVHVQVYARVTG